MSFVILDLEWNGSYSAKEHRFVNEIIEIGAIKTDDKFNVIDKFEMLISPQISKKLCSKVKELTHINYEELLNSGCTFMHAISKFKKFAENSTIITWGTSDILALIENYMYYQHSLELPFLHSYCNAQAYCEKCLSVESYSSQLGLSACADMLSILFDEEEQHRAYADALLTLKCIEHLLDDYLLEPYIENANCKEFYDKMMFKTHFLTDLKNPEIDKRKMRFNCEICGRQAAKQTAWKLHNKSFNAEFKCNGCGNKFVGRISFKKKYDEVVIRKKVLSPKVKNTVIVNNKG